MLLICGALVNGPYALITTAVSADLVSRAPSGTGQGLCLQAHLPHIFPLPPQSPPESAVGPRFFPTPSPQGSLSPSQPLSRSPSCSGHCLLVQPPPQHPNAGVSLQGTHKSLKGNAKALSTVTAIIDGTGSIGL